MKRRAKLILIFVLLASLSAATLLTLGSCGMMALSSFIATRDVEVVVGGAHFWVMPTGKKAAFMYFDADKSLGDGELQVCKIPETVTYRGDSYPVVSIGAMYGVETSTIIHGNAQIGELIVPGSVEAIDLSCYSDLDSLESIVVDAKNNTYYSADGVLYSNENYDFLDSYDLIYYPVAKKDATVELPRGFRSIDEGSHVWENEYLQNFTIAYGSIYYVAINGALYSKDGEELLFYPVHKSDTTFVAPKKMRRIATDSHFWENKNIQNVEVEEDSLYLKADGNVLYSKDGSELVFRLNHGKPYFAIPSSVSVVHCYALMGLEYLYVPSSVVVFLDVFTDSEVYLTDIEHIYFESEVMPKYLHGVTFTDQQVRLGYARETFDQLVSNL